MNKLRIESLDALRGVAVLMVFTYHIVSNVQTVGVLTDPARWVLATGMFGVDLFYVLSGFFITRAIIFPAQWSQREYFTSRIFRIYPAYIVCLVLCLAVAVATKDLILIDVSGAFALHLLMLHNFVPRMSEIFNGVFWTLGVEFPYYLWMLLIGHFIRNEKLFLPISLACIAAAMLYRLSVFQFIPMTNNGEFNRFFISTQVFGSLDAFFIGGVVAYITLKKRDNHGSRAVPLFVASIVCSALLLYYCSLQLKDYWSSASMMVLWRTVLAASFGLNILLIVNINFKQLLKKTGLPFLGKISFSFYLWHAPVIAYFTNAPQPAVTSVVALLQKVALIAVASLSIGWASWYFIENRLTATVRSGDTSA